MQPAPPTASIPSRLNIPLVAGLAMLAAGWLVAYRFAATVYEALPPIPFPEAPDGNPIHAFVIYVVLLIFQASGPVLLHLFGLSLAALGAVVALIGLVQIIIRRVRRAPGT